jgi:hypothetical protein
MNVRAVCGALILDGLVAVTTRLTSTMAQLNEPGVSAPKDAGAPASKSATPSKHRYWRHRGGKHPHYGSRRVRT